MYCTTAGHVDSFEKDVSRMRNRISFDKIKQQVFLQLLLLFFVLHLCSISPAVAHHVRNKVHCLKSHHILCVLCGKIVKWLLNMSNIQNVVIDTVFTETHLVGPVKRSVS